MLIDFGKVTQQDLSDIYTGKLKQCVICNKWFRPAYKNTIVCSNKCRCKYIYIQKLNDKEN